MLAGRVCATILAMAMATVAVAQDTATPPTLSERFDQWSREPLSFAAEIRNQRRSSPDFYLSINGIRYKVLFDAGREKRQALLDCLDLSDACDLRGRGFMLFEKGALVLNVTDVSWLSIPPVNFDEQASRFHNCIRNSKRTRDSFAAIVEARLDVLDVGKPQGWALSPVDPREGGRGFELVHDAVADCMRHRVRLPVGRYQLKVYTQSAETFFSYWEHEPQ